MRFVAIRTSMAGNVCAGQYVQELKQKTGVNYKYYKSVDTGSFDLIMPWMILLLLPLPIIIDKVTLDKYTEKAEKDSNA